MLQIHDNNIKGKGIISTIASVTIWKIQDIGTIFFINKYIMLITISTENIILGCIFPITIFGFSKSKPKHIFPIKNIVVAPFFFKMQTKFIDIIIIKIFDIPIIIIKAVLFSASLVVPPPSPAIINDIKNINISIGYLSISLISSPFDFNSTIFIMLKIIDIVII